MPFLYQDENLSCAWCCITTSKLQKRVISLLGIRDPVCMIRDIIMILIILNLSKATSSPSHNNESSFPLTNLPPLSSYKENEILSRNTTEVAKVCRHHTRMIIMFLLQSLSMYSYSQKLLPQFVISSRNVLCKLYYYFYYVCMSLNKMIFKMNEIL